VAGYAGGGEVIPFPISLAEADDNRGRLDRALERVRDRGIPEHDIQSALGAMAAPVVLSPYAERAAGGGVRGYEDGGAPSFDERFYGLPDDAPVRSIANAYIHPEPEHEWGPTVGGVAGDTMWQRQAKDDYALAQDDPVRLDRGKEPEEAAEADDGSDEGGGSQNAPRGGSGPPVMAYSGPDHYRAAPDAVTRPHGLGGIGFGLISPNAKMGLLAAGLGALSSRSPFLGNALGDAGLAGLSAYGHAEEADRKAQLEADKLARETEQTAYDRWMGNRKQTEVEHHNKAMEEKEFKPQLVHRTNPATGMEEYSLFDPNTKQMKPITFPTSGEKVEPYKSSAAPKEERRKALPASPEARDEGYLDWLEQHRPPGYADTVRAVADYEMDPNRVESLQKGARAQLYRDAKLYDATYDQTHFKEKGDVIASFSKGQDRQAVNSLNVAVSHLGTLQKLGDALQNGDFVLWNKLRNAAGIQVGRPEATNFNAAKEIVGDEVVKAIVGGVSAQADRDAIKHLIMAQQSPAQLKGTINTFVDLLGGQLEGRRIGYQAGTGLNNFDRKYLSPETQEALSARSRGTVNPQIERMVYPSGVPVPQGAPSGGGFVPPPGAIPRVFNGKTYYYTPDTHQPYPGQ
jgi:hypothetical protein